MKTRQETMMGAIISLKTEAEEQRKMVVEHLGRIEKISGLMKARIKSFGGVYKIDVDEIVKMARFIDEAQIKQAQAERVAQNLSEALDKVMDEAYGDELTPEDPSIPTRHLDAHRLVERHEDAWIPIHELTFSNLGTTRIRVYQVEKGRTWIVDSKDASVHPLFKAYDPKGRIETAREMIKVFGKGISITAYQMLRDFTAGDWESHLAVPPSRDREPMIGEVILSDEFKSEFGIATDEAILVVDKTGIELKADEDYIWVADRVGFQEALRLCGNLPMPIEPSTLTRKGFRRIM